MRREYRAIQNLGAGLAAILVGASCVSTGKHEALQKAYDATKMTMANEREACAGEVGRLEGANKELQGELDACQESLGASQEELAKVMKSRSDLKSSVDEMQNALKELEKRKRAADKRVAQFKDLIERFKPLIDTGKLAVRIVDGRMVVQMKTDVLFASGRASLSKEGKEAIAEVATRLAEVPMNYQVEGHTDNVPINTKQYPSNWELSVARALAVTHAMLASGVDATRVSAAGFGENKPTASNEKDKGRAQNRRIEIVVLPDLSSLPGFDELQAIAKD